MIEPLKVIDELYTTTTQMREVIRQLLKSLGENYHGPKVAPWVHNVQHQLKYAELGLKAIEKAHELERQNRPECSTVQLSVYKVIMSEIEKLDLELEEMMKCI